MGWQFQPGPLEGLFLVTPQIHRDGRGWFSECWHEDEFAAHGIGVCFVQDNRSFSRRGVFRGLHFQGAPFAQAKLFTCLSGLVWDVVADLRRGSPTFGQCFTIELSAENGLMLFIPTGFAHGFVTLSESAQTFYKCSAVYDKPSEGGIRWDDPRLAIPWPAALDPTLIGEKDRQLPRLADLGEGFGL